MNTLVNYFIEANFGLIFFIVVYWLFLRNENQFSFKRIFLLAGIILSLSLPLFRFNSPSSEKVIPTLRQLVPTYWLPEITLPAAGQGNATGITSSGWRVAEWTYSIVVLILVATFVVRLGGIVQMILRSKKYRWNSYFITESEEEKPTFSFFNFIFIGQANRLSASEKEEVLRHESVHVSSYHTVDLLLLSLLEVLFWFNPVIRGYKKILVQLHEFEADAHSVQDKDVDGYCHLLAKVALQSSGLSLVNYFNSSLTLKRIRMMKTNKHKVGGWKVAVLVATVPLFFLAVSCQDQVANDLQYIGKNSTMVGVMPSQVKAQLDFLQQQNPDKKYIVLQLNDEGMKTLNRLKFENAQTSSQFPSMTLITTDKNSDGGGFTYIILEDGRLARRIVQAEISEDKVYQFSEKQPQFAGGMDSLIAYVLKEMKYPEEARKAGIQGKVFIAFVIDKNGNVIRPEIVKGVSSALDKEALRVVAGFPKWIPGENKGEAVSVKFVMPINFKI